MIRRIKTRLRPSGNTGILHDSRTDVHTLMKVCNELIEKLNEVIDKVNQLEQTQGGGGIEGN